MTIVRIKKQGAWIQILLKIYLNRYNESKVVLMNNKCMRHSTNRIQSNDYRIGTYEINKILLSCFDGRIYFQSNGYNALALEYWVNHTEIVILIPI